MTTPESVPSETSLFKHPMRYLSRLFTGPPAPHSLDDRELPVQETLELLAPERRRAILTELATTDQTSLSVSTLAERVACAEYGCTTDTLETDQRKRVYIALTQSHLPPLNDADVVSYDPESKLVDRGPEFERVWRTYSVILKTLHSSRS